MARRRISINGDDRLTVAVANDSNEADDAHNDDENNVDAVM